MNVPTYAPSSSCPKCWASDASALWMPNTNECWGQWCDFDLEKRNIEHMHRACNRCKHQWAEAVNPDGPPSATLPADTEEDVLHGDSE